MESSVKSIRLRLIDEDRRGVPFIIVVLCSGAAGTAAPSAAVSTAPTDRPGQQYRGPADDGRPAPGSHSSRPSVAACRRISRHRRSGSKRETNYWREVRRSGELSTRCTD